MKATRSELVFEDLLVWRHEVQFLAAESDEPGLAQRMKKELHELPIEVDIGNQNGDEKNDFQVNLVLRIQPPENGHGYRILLSMTGLFQLDPEGISEDRYKNLRYFSALNLMISNAREKIRQSTQELPLGAYFLPPLDLKDLIQKKREETDNEKNDR